MDPWEQRRQEMLSGDDRPAFWLGTIYQQQDEPDDEGTRWRIPQAVVNAVFDRAYDAGVSACRGTHDA